jgi:hypothetical protein
MKREREQIKGRKSSNKGAYFHSPKVSLHERIGIIKFGVRQSGGGGGKWIG